MERELHITGMTCGHCVMTVTEAIARLPGVVSVQVDLSTGLTLVGGEGLDEVSLREAVAEAGYGTR